VVDNMVYRRDRRSKTNTKLKTTELYLLSSTKLDRSMPAPEVRVSAAVVHGRTGGLPT